MHDLAKATQSSDSCTAPKEEETTLDDILVQLGQFGRFQSVILWLTCLPVLFNAISTVTYVFTASNVVHRCKISECDTAHSHYNESWTQFTIPPKSRDLDQCHRYATKSLMNNTAHHMYSIQPNKEDGSLCEASHFDATMIENCPNNDFIFRDKEVTISNDFGIYCADEWKLSLVGTINNIGQFVGIPLGGFISDKYGRRIALVGGGLLSAFFGVWRSFVHNYNSFLILEFLDNVAGSSLYPICFIIGIELVGPKKRVFACSVITIFYAIGEILLALVSKYYQNWRVMLRILYVPAFALIAYLWVMPESVRWLLSQSKEEAATDILKKAAKVNRRQLSNATLDKLIVANRIKLSTATGGSFPIKAAFTKLFWRIANCSFCWMVNVLVYYGLSLNAVLLAGNKYHNFMLIAFVEIPGFFIPCATMNRYGRRYSLFGYMLLSGLCCLGTVFLNADQHYWQLALFLVGKLAITAAFQVLYFFTSEIFPTNLRNSLLSVCSMVGRVGSMIAPQMPLLAKYNENIPAILFASCAILSGFLSLLFPETANVILPTTVNEADGIGAKKIDAQSDPNSSHLNLEEAIRY